MNVMDGIFLDSIISYLFPSYLIVRLNICGYQRERRYMCFTEPDRVFWKGCDYTLTNWGEYMGLGGDTRVKKRTGGNEDIGAGRQQQQAPQKKIKCAAKTQR